LHRYFLIAHVPGPWSKGTHLCGLSHDCSAELSALETQHSRTRQMSRWTYSGGGIGQSGNAQSRSETPAPRACGGEGGWRLADRGARLHVRIEVAARMKWSCERSHARTVDRRAEASPKSSWPQQLNSEQAARRVGDRTKSKETVDEDAAYGHPLRPRNTPAEKSLRKGECGACACASRHVCTVHTPMQEKGVGTEGRASSCVDW
jgi:hypothetical protein